MKNKKNVNRKCKISVITKVYGLLFMIIVIVINLIISIAAKDYSLTIDLTKNQVFTLSEDTLELLEGLNEPIKLMVMAREEEFKSGSIYFTQANEIIGQYEKNSNHIQVEYIDYTSNPAIPQAYEKLKPKALDIVVASGERAVLVKFQELFYLTSDETGQTIIESSKTEQTISSAILNVSTKEQIKITVIETGKEIEYTEFINQLKANNYEIEKVNLLSGEPDEESKLAIMIAPDTDLDAVSIERLEQWLNDSVDGDRSLLYFADNTQGKLPQLESFFKEWGILVMNGTVYETKKDKSYNYNPYYTFVDGEPLLMSLSKPLQVIETAGIERKVLFGFSSTAGIIPVDAKQNFDFIKGISKSPIPALISSCKIKYDDLKAQKSELLVSASSLSIGNEAFLNPALSNQKLYLELIADQTHGESPVAIFPKKIMNENLTIDDSRAVVIGSCFLLLLPTGVLLLGIIVCMRRRNR